MVTPEENSTGLSICLDGCQGVFQLQGVTAQRERSPPNPGHAFARVKCHNSPEACSALSSQEDKVTGACSTPPWAGTFWLLLRLPGGLWGLGTPQDADPPQGLSNGCAGTGSSALGHSWWDNTQSWGKSHLPTLTGACSPMATHLQPVTTLAALCSHATNWGQAGHSRVWLGKNYPHWHWLWGDLHLDESTSRKMVFAPILDDGLVPKYL